MQLLAERIKKSRCKGESLCGEQVKGSIKNSGKRYFVEIIIP